MKLLVTRPEPDASLTAEKLVRLGHEAFVAPVMETVFSGDLHKLDDTDVLVATSRNGVRALHRVSNKNMFDKPLFVVGDASADLAREFGFTNVYSANGVVDDLIHLFQVKRGQLETKTIIYFAGRDRKGGFEVKARALGLKVEVVEAYKAERIANWPPEIIDFLNSGHFDGVLLYSARTAEMYLSLLTQNYISQTTNLLPHFCLANAVANVFDASMRAHIRVAAKPNEAELFNLIEQYS